MDGTTVDAKAVLALERTSLSSSWAPVTEGWNSNLFFIHLFMVLTSLFAVQWVVCLAQQVPQTTCRFLSKSAVGDHDAGNIYSRVLRPHRGCSKSICRHDKCVIKLLQDESEKKRIPNRKESQKIQLLFLPRAGQYEV